MKNLRKLLALLLVIVISCTMLLTSCKKNNDDDDDYDDEIENGNGNGNGSGNENGNEGGNETETYIYEPWLNVWMDGDVEIMESAYDKNGRLVSNRFTNLDWVETAIFDYTYDEAGKITKIVFQESFFYPEVEYQFSLVDGASYAVGASIEYHENGAVKKMMFEEFWDFEFDQNGRLTAIGKSVIFNYEGDAKKPNSYVFNDTKENEQIVVDIAYNDKGYVSTLTSADNFLVTYTYDENGNVINQTELDKYSYDVCECQYNDAKDITNIVVTEYDDETKTKITDKVVIGFTYNSAGVVIGATSEEFGEGGESEGVLLVSLEYDANGRITKTTQSYDDQAYVVEYQYDSNGKKIAEIESYYDEEILSYKETASLQYDLLGRVVKETWVTYYGEEIHGKSVSEYKYDNKHRIISDAYLEYDANDVYLGKTVYETAYDADGKATSFVTKYDKDGNIITESNNSMGGW